jgi:hypothetical protein
MTAQTGLDLEIDADGTIFLETRFSEKGPNGLEKFRCLARSGVSRSAAA